MWSSPEQHALPDVRTSTSRVCEVTREGFDRLANCNNMEKAVVYYHSAEGAGDDRMTWRKRHKARCSMRVLVTTLCLIGLLWPLPTSRSAAQSVRDAFDLGMELGLGKVAREQFIALFGEPVTLPLEHKRWIDTVFRDIVRQAERREIRYSLTILPTNHINAFATPGGGIVLTTGLLYHVWDDVDALANILAHEVAHIERKHGLDTLMRTLRLSLPRGSSPPDESDIWRYAEEKGVESLLVGWGREMEHEADALGQLMAARAGYDPYGLVRFFAVVREHQQPLPTMVHVIDVHPHIGERTERARVRAASLEVAERRTPRPSPPELLPPEELLAAVSQEE